MLSFEIKYPFDINSGADYETHSQAVKILDEDPNVDVAVVGLDPLVDHLVEGGMVAVFRSSCRAVYGPVRYVEGRLNADLLRE